MYSVYVILNEKGERYIGYTGNLKERLKKHNEGDNTSTKGHRWVLVYAEGYLSKEDALQRERMLKQHGMSKKHLYNRIERSIKKAECWEGVAEGGADD